MPSCTSPPSPNALSLAGIQQQEIPRFTGRPSEQRTSFPPLKSSSSVSPDAMQSEYSFRGVGIHRPHSLASFHNSSVAESPEDQYSLRRGSDPVELSTNTQHPRHYSISTESYESGWESQNASASVSPVDQSHSAPNSALLHPSNWGWDDRSRSGMEDTQWYGSYDGGQVNGQQIPHDYHHGALAHSPASMDDHHSARAASVEEPYPSMLFARHTPSPLMEANDALSGLCAPCKRPGSPSVPSPPESPGWKFDPSNPQIVSAPTDIMYSNGYRYSSHHGMYPHHDPRPARMSGIPPTPPSRPASVNTDTANVMAAMHVLNATAKHGKGPKHRLQGRRKASNSSMRNTARQCSISSNAEEMNFVNYTPNDASRILNGVAPSGSSKTKARREREARDKRIKLQEAAAAAVIAAGGDANSIKTIL